MARGSKRSRTPGRWELRWDEPRGEDGKRRPRQKTFKGTAKEADAELNRVMADVAKNPAERAVDMPVRELCRLFLEEQNRTLRLRPTTVRGYDKFFRNDLLPECGEVPLGKVDRPVLQRVIQRMIERGLCPTTIGAEHTRLHGVFSWGVDAGYLVDTPVKKLSLPKCTQRSSGEMLSVVESGEVLAIFKGTRYWLPTYLALHTGMRPGEVLALSWDDVDLAARTLFVRHTAHWESGSVRLGPPKTESSRRSVGISEEVVEVLRERENGKPNAFWIAVRGRVGDVREGRAVATEFNQVCAQPDGGLVTAQSWEDGFRRGLPRAGFRKIRPHDLRHTHASLLLLDGAPILVVSKRLGHSSVQTTLNCYGHLLSTSDLEAADRFTDILGNGGQ